MNTPEIHTLDTEFTCFSTQANILEQFTIQAYNRAEPQEDKEFDFLAIVEETKAMKQKKAIDNKIREIKELIEKCNQLRIEVLDQCAEMEGYSPIV